MAATITKGSKVVVDETAGLQNATATPTVTGDSDDNDILLNASTFPSAFGVLSAFGSVTKTGLSGYTGASGNTGSDAFTVSATGAISDVSFVGPDGLPLSGLDSGILTLDGTKIFLYTDANNNVVLGRVGLANGTADPNGVVAFAGYIEETLTGGATTGGKIWLTEYQPLKHLNAADPDDAVDLTGKVFVGVSQDVNFSLAGAPSGQQLFLMFTTEGATADANGRIPGVSIVVTGRDPLNQSASSDAITSGDTVNSSQGGGNTTLGTNNQAITEQEGLRFSFVSGAKADFTIPNLSPGEAGVEANIDFTQYFAARSATFQVVQETGGTSAKIKLTAINTDGSGGTAFIDGYADDLKTQSQPGQQVAITNGSVTVKTFAGATISTAVVTYNADGTVLISGVPTDAQITYRTDSDHDRVLIENAGSLTAKNGDKTHADFDIGGFQVLQTSVDKLEIGSNMVFEDDGPSLAFGNLIGTGTLNPQFGTWSMAAGADGLQGNSAGTGTTDGGVNIAMTGFQLVKPDSSVANGSSFSFSETAPSPDGNGSYHFTGSVTGDLDNDTNTADITEHFTMTVLANGTYNIDLVEGFQSTFTESTANGTLGAGGPDAVQTLTVGTDHIVFFSAVPTASVADLVSQGTQLGTPDFTEAQLETAHPAVIDFTRAMNVSTSGIGDGNNNLDGDANAAIGNADESFVANPGTEFTSAKVFIDNSVTGYNFTGGERLYYRLIYADGSTDGAGDGEVLVSTNIATTGSKPVAFTVVGSGKPIDAIQLTMAKGTVKIPEIQFITTTNSLADSLQLAFTASIKDGDGDSATSNFVANLSANALGSAFDFVLNGTANALDWFNVDLTQSQTKFQVNGLDTGTTRDKLVLLGQPGATFTIDNSGADAVVSVTESGTGQTTTVTVVGVDLLNSDIALV